MAKALPVGPLVGGPARGGRQPASGHGGGAAPSRFFLLAAIALAAVAAGVVIALMVALNVARA